MFRHKSSLVDSDALRSTADLERPLTPSREDSSVPASSIGVNLVDALLRSRRSPQVEWVIVERVLVDVINFRRVRVASRHGVDDTVRGVVFPIDVDQVEGVGFPFVGEPPPCHSSLWTAASVYGVATPRRAC